LLLPERLVRTRIVVEAHELGDEAAEVALAHEDNVVEQVPAEGAREPFGERVHVRRPGRNPHDLRPRRGEHAGEASAELRVAVADDDRRRRIQGAFRACWAHHSSLGTEVTAAWMIRRRRSSALRHAGARRAASPIVKRCHGAQPTRPAILRCATMSCCRSSAFSATRPA